MSVLIVCKKGEISSQLRSVLLGIGFNSVNSASGYVNGLVYAKENDISLVFFDAETPDGSELTATQFVENLRKLRKNSIPVAVSIKGTGDSLFTLLKAGAKGFLLPPFTPGAVEEVFVAVQSGMQLSEDVLNAEDRNKKFAELIQEQLDKVSEIVKKNPGTELNQEALERRMQGFNETVRVAKFFCESSEQALMTTLHSHLIQRSEEMDQMANQTRLRLTRQKLKEQRSKK